MSKKYQEDAVAFVLYNGDIYLIKDSMQIQLTKGYKIPYLKKTKNTKDKIYFKYNDNKFYYDKQEGRIYFTNYKGDYEE